MRVDECLRLQQRQIRIDRAQRLAHERRHRDGTGRGAHEDVGEGLGPLQRRQEVVGFRRRVQARAAHVGDDADDLRRQLSHAGDQGAADRILAGKVPARERLVDDHDVRHARAVALVEVAPGANRNAERLEVSRRHEMTIRVRPLAHRRQRPAHHRDRRRRLSAGERHAIGQRRRRRAGQRRQALIELLVERDELLAVVALRRQHQLRGEDAVRLEAGLDALEPGETGQQQAGADQQHERQRHFGDQQAGAQPLARCPWSRGSLP